MAGGSLQSHATGRRYLALISAGKKRAVGFWNGFSWEGGWAWRWKDRIDREFVSRYR
jgi:selenide,water dikinase